VISGIAQGPHPGHRKTTKGESYIIWILQNTIYFMQNIIFIIKTMQGRERVDVSAHLEMKRIGVSACAEYQYQMPALLPLTNDN
jgi:hypothetical protein